MSGYSIQPMAVFTLQVKPEDEVRLVIQGLLEQVGVDLEDQHAARGEPSLPQYVFRSGTADVTILLSLEAMVGLRDMLLAESLAQPALALLYLRVSDCLRELLQRGARHG